MRRHRLNLVDRAFFMLESNEATCHVGLLAIFTPPAGAGPEFVQTSLPGCARRDIAAPFNYTLAHHLPTALIGPRLELAPEAVDLDYRFRHSSLPRPGSQRDPHLQRMTGYLADALTELEAA